MRSLLLVVWTLTVVATLLVVAHHRRAATANFPGQNGLIAFAGRTDLASEDMDIWVVDPEGGEPTNLTEDMDGWLTSPAWSPDGTRLLFTEGHGLTWVMDADGGNKQPLEFIRQKGYGTSDSAWSPDGCSIAFETSTPYGEGGGLYIANLRTGNVNRVVVGVGYSLDGGPSWSPDGTRLAVTRGQSLWLVDTDGTNLSQLQNTIGNTPSWSPDGQRIAFMGAPDPTNLVGPTQIGIVQVSSGQVTYLPMPEGNDGDGSPAWSPNGAEIAFSRFVDNSQPPDIVVGASDGTNQRNLDLAAFNPSWLDWQPIPPGQTSPPCAIPATPPTPDGFPAGGGAVRGEGARVPVMLVIGAFWASMGGLLTFLGWRTHPTRGRD